jgi:ADP-ribose pyrophosphatase YjhB (NUDIX family)
VGVAATILSRCRYLQQHQGSDGGGSGWRVLLVKRGKPPSQGCWSLPGGLLGLGEEVVPAALREVQEETGIAVAAAVPLVTGADPKFLVTDSVHWAHPGAARPQWHYVLAHVLCFADDRLEPGRHHIHLR